MSKIGSAITQKTDIPSLSTEIATDIYTRYKGGESAKDMFENPETNFYWKHIKEVVNGGGELERIEDKVEDMIKGRDLISEEVVDDEGNVTQEAVYYEVTTKTDFVNRLNSELDIVLDAETVLDDYIEACGYDNWTDWKTNYPNKDTESEE